MSKITQEEFEKRIADIKAQELRLGVEIDFEAGYCRDKDHLDCIWYGGRVGRIMYKGYTLVIEAHGEVRISGVVNGEEFSFKDKNDMGMAYDEFGDEIDDERLYQLFDSENEQDYLDWENNNWFEVDLFDKEGNYIDLCGADNVLSDNILDCFSNVSDYFEYIEWAEEGKI